MRFAKQPEKMPAMATAPQYWHRRYDLLGRSAADLRSWMASLGEPAYRGAQIYHALYAERRFALADMTNLPAALRTRLAGESRIGLPEISRPVKSWAKCFWRSTITKRRLLRAPTWS